MVISILDQRCCVKVTLHWPGSGQDADVYCILFSSFWQRTPCHIRIDGLWCPGVKASGLGSRILHPALKCAALPWVGHAVKPPAAFLGVHFRQQICPAEVSPEQQTEVTGARKPFRPRSAKVGVLSSTNLLSLLSLLSLPEVCPWFRSCPLLGPCLLVLQQSLVCRHWAVNNTR